MKFQVCKRTYNDNKCTSMWDTLKRCCKRQSTKYCICFCTDFDTIQFAGCLCLIQLANYEIMDASNKLVAHRLPKLQFE